MAKTMNTADTTPSSPDGTKKQRKKQAKREAKAMLKLEQSRKDVQKAEQKVARAQAQLEDSRTRLRNLEAEVEKMQTSHSDSRADTTSTSQQAPTQTGMEGYAYVSTPTNQVASLSPAEGRTDVLRDESNSSGSAEDNGNTSQEQETALTNQADSLPPAEGRTDIPQEQETTSDQEANNGDTSQEEESSAPPETETAWHPVESWEQAVQAEEVPHEGTEAEDVQEATDQ